MADLSAGFMELIQSAMESAGAEMADRISQSISLPIPPRSRPGEPPRRDSGLLISTVAYDVTTTGDGQMSLSVGAGPANAPEDGFDYAPYLESSMDRPYVLSRAEELVDLFLANMGTLE